MIVSVFTKTKNINKISTYNLIIRADDHNKMKLQKGDCNGEKKILRNWGPKGNICVHYYFAVLQYINTIHASTPSKLRRKIRIILSSET
jgi:hypothetical protein